MRLDQLLDGIATPARGDIVVSGLSLDSRRVKAGDMFVALAGGSRHGIEFAPVVHAQGAVAVLAEKSGPGTRDSGLGKSTAGTSATVSPEPTSHCSVPPLARDPAPTSPESRVPGPGGSPNPETIWITDLRSHLGTLAARFYGDPSAALEVIGVTGTNGKTTTVQLLAQAFSLLGHRAASIGTLGAGLHGDLRAGERTTPDVLSVQGLLAEFRDAGATQVAMEVSSHALDQRRVDGVRFDVAVFTNLTRDHLDYHGSMQAYGAAKAKLFDWPNLRAAVINVDDAFGRELAAGLPAGVQRMRYAIDADDAELRARNVHTHADGLDFELQTLVGGASVRSRLLGRFNVANLLAVAGVLIALEVPFAQVLATLAALQPVAGRMHRVGGGGRPLVVVDYAHTPDALQQALTTLREHCAGKLICVFGCGGERDTGKRPVMGALAERLADTTIVTDDNPRGEDGDAIVAQIVAGMHAPGGARVERDRGLAIGMAIAQARPGDIVLIAGKGHEAYQESGGVKRPFDDAAVAAAALEMQPC